MTTEEKFRAAVNVIRNLPKNVKAGAIRSILFSSPGSYQPSHELMLRFYAYYKQATEGPCTAPRPSFWEVVKKMKWEAWSKLGDMSKEEAMNNYVEELKKIVETMSYTDNVANFLGSLGSFYDSVPVEDLELLVGNVIERIRSQPGSPLSGSPFASREASPSRIQITTNGHPLTSSLETSPASSYSPSPQLDEMDEDDDEEFIDTVEAEPDNTSKETALKVTIRPPPTVTDAVNGSDPVYTDQPSVVSNGYKKKPSSLKGRHNPESIEAACQNARATYQERGRSRERNNQRVNIQTDDQCIPETAEETLQKLLEPLEVTDKLRTAVVQLQKDLNDVCGRMRNLEHTVSTIRKEASRNMPRWWPFRQVPPGFAVFVILWPIVFHFTVLWLQRRRQRRLL
ncbi:acyl-CoA-binding domain-containing protein 5 isoform X1 [Schistocerca serialis cubense]|uniref:acyl-CoA-binding domain-containing protein 5 isoform X1 n=1 Tax=Schistocerca serialis cubense TaxID=2023355 RepID=UPI00214EAEC3|nr:acyl-CoA-binding domain-containing protein 5 isoform X1 [Schistocerca serialis cubense]